MRIPSYVIILEKTKKKLYLAVSSTKTFFFLIKTQLCKLRVILRSRMLRGVYTLLKDTGR